MSRYVQLHAEPVRLDNFSTGQRANLDEVQTLDGFVQQADPVGSVPANK